MTEGTREPDAATIEAVHQLEVAVEWVERAWGALLDCHHQVGHGQLLMLGAARALAAAGHDGTAERLEREIAGLDVLPGRWTFRMVDEFREGFLEPVRRFEQDARERLVGGRRHRYEAALREEAVAKRPADVA
jgi:hypothetical protein